jgi:thymidine kinase
MDKGGGIQLIVGPMFSGKSTELVRRVQRYRHAKKSCLVINHASDKRYGANAVITHNTQKLEAVSCVRLCDVTEQALAHDVVAIDEGQFFDDLVDAVDKLADSGVTVIVAGLDSTFQRRPFSNICELVARAESVTKLLAVCLRCGDDAAFTRRLTTDTQTNLVGGAETYMPSCRRCFTLGD